MSLNGQTTKYLDQAKVILENNKNKTLPALILRDQKQIVVNVKVNGEGKLGVQLGALGLDSLEKLGYYKITHQKYSFLESIPFGIEKGKDQLVGYGKQLKMIFNPETKAYKQVGGFHAIYNIFPSSWSWEVFWSITAILSIMLGVMNLLPIPALDGGRLWITLVARGIFKRPLTAKTEEIVNVIGFMTLIGLIFLITIVDVKRFF